MSAPGMEKEKKKSLYMGPVAGEGHWITMHCSKLRLGMGEYYGRDCILTQQPMWCPPRLKRFVQLYLRFLEFQSLSPLGGKCIHSMGLAS